MDTEFLTGSCPKCGETLQVPAHLKQFSCMFCGARLAASELSTESPAAPAPETAQDGATYYKAHILEAITAYPGIERSVTKSAFVPAFERYESGNAETFRRLDDAVSGGALTVEAAAEEFLNQLEAHWASQPRWRTSRTAIMDTDKFVIAIFLVPMVRKLGLGCSEDYCKALHSLWCQRHPKSVFKIGNYEDIAGGFQRKLFGLCFITSAVCRDSGKPDDCAELTAFRGFRDGYLRACPDGPALISEYYDVAPGIVTRMELSSDRAELYAALRKDYLEPCFADIQAGRLARCKDRYVEMVRSLEEKYLN